MSFVAPGLLFGMALIAVPVVLHLIMRQRPRHVPFPPLRFLAVRREANQRRLRLRNLLLLLLRCAAIALLVLALARPTIRGSGWLGGGEAPVAAALIFDTAPHMGYRHQNKTRLEEAVQTVYRKARSAGVGVGMHYSESDGTKKLAAWARSGMNLIIHSSDLRIVGSMLKQDIATLRAELGDVGQIPPSARSEREV